MSEPVTITVELNIKPEAADAFCSGLGDSFNETEKQPGFQSIRAVRFKDDPTKILLVEVWDSEQAYGDYIAWRQQRGDMDGMAAVLTAPPKMSVWPTLIAAR